MQFQIKKYQLCFKMCKYFMEFLIFFIYNKTIFDIADEKERKKIEKIFKK